jgi:hypothetical protein
MAQRKAYPLRLDPAVYDALQRWADAELRSLNGQIDFVLRRALEEAGRLPVRGATGREKASDGTDSSSEP